MVADKDKKYEEWIESWDMALRQGRIQATIEAIKALVPGEIPRPYRQPIASLCARAGIYSTGLKILTKTVIDEQGSVYEDCTDAELTEYSILLQQVGLADEALSKLGMVNIDKSPQAMLYQAIAYFSKWDYQSAIPLLRAYANHEKVDPYKKLVGKVNLLASLVHTDQFTESEVLFGEIVGICRENQYTRLHANTLELFAQIQLQKNDLSRARSALDQADSMFRKVNVRDQLFIRKWRSYLTGLDRGNSDELLRFRADALKGQHWESVREADFLLLKIEFDQDRFNQLLYGTPLENYQKRVLKTFGQHQKVDERVLLNHNAEHRLDMFAGLWKSEMFVDPGRKVHHLLCTLLMDLYKPASLGQLYPAVFPGDHFDVYSSPNKVRQIINRARALLKEKKIPAKIHAKAGSFSLETDDSVGIILPFDKSLPKREELVLAPLFRNKENSLLSRIEIIRKLQLPEATVGRLLRKGIEHGTLEKFGNGIHTRYRFLKAG